MRALPPSATRTCCHLISLDITQCHDRTVPKLSQHASSTSGLPSVSSGATCGSCLTYPKSYPRQSRAGLGVLDIPYDRVGRHGQWSVLSLRSCVRISTTGKVGRPGANEQGRDHRVRADSAGAASHPKSAARRIAGLCNGRVRGRRAKLANRALRLEERQEVCVDHVRVNGAHAVRVPLVDLKCPILNQLRRDQRGISDRHDLVVIAVHDQYGNFQVL